MPPQKYTTVKNACTVLNSGVFMMTFLLWLFLRHIHVFSPILDMNLQVCELSEQDMIPSFKLNTGWNS